MASLMYCAPDKWSAQHRCNELSREEDMRDGNLLAGWDGPRWWFRTEHRVGRGWCVVRRQREEHVDA